MPYQPFNRFLRSEAHEMGDGGGAAPAAAAPAAETPAAAPPAPAAATATAAAQREPTMLEKVQAALRDKGVILAENNGFKAEIAALKGDLAERDVSMATLQARVVTLEAENTQLQADFLSIDAALKSTEARVVAVDTAAARQIAGMGFEASVLPAAETAAETVEGLVAKMTATTDPQEKYKLAARINALDAGN
jgi:chromosome segregation ATPase